MNLHDRTDRIAKDLDRLTAQVPLRVGGDNGAVETVLIIGGQSFGSYTGITYASTVTPTQVWDPDVHTSGYPAGLGYGQLYSDGFFVGNVLVRWNGLGGRTSPLLAGRSCRVLGSELLTVASGPDAGSQLITSVVGWE